MSHVFCSLSKIDELDAIKIEHPSFNATLLLQGAQLIDFSPKSNQFQNTLWLSPSAQYKLGQPIRGGIPICWPWFGNIDKNPAVIQHQMKNNTSASAHGFARSLMWEIKSILEDCHYIEVILSLSSSLASKEVWPFDFELEAKFTFSNKMELVLTTKNIGNESYSVSQALHTYLPTKDINHSYIHNTHNLKYIDALDHWQEKQQIGKIHFNTETDRLYFFDKKDHSLRLETPEQSLLINSTNSQSAVIWNPWTEKSKRLSQFSPFDFQTMLCIETANVLSDSRDIKAGEQTSISVEMINAD
jgi:glucose-6-phosphate 1-epimerase